MLLQFAPAAGVRQYDWSRKQVIVFHLFLTFPLLLCFKMLVLYGMMLYCFPKNLTQTSKGKYDIFLDFLLFSEIELVLLSLL